MRRYWLFTLLTITTIIGCQDTRSRRAIRLEDYKAEARAVVKAISVADVLDSKGDLVLVDVREKEELDRYGVIPGSVHVPRGVLEFYIDPASSMHLDVFASQKRVVFLCETGGRSLLAAKVAIDMGVKNPFLLAGGFKAWTEEGGPVEKTEEDAKQ